MQYADLHLHSTASDGNWTPREVVRAAREKGFSCIALTDHDTVGGVSKAMQAGEELGVEVLPGVEFSTQFKGGEVHVLGYCMDWNHAGLHAELKKVTEARLNRGRKMVEKLMGYGVDISWEEILDIAGGGTVGRPHIARALVSKGYIDSISEAFTEEYIGKGGRSYVERYKLSPERAVQLTRDAGGVAVLAHPGLFKKDARLEREDIKYMVKHGMQGIEVWHTEHSPEDSDYYENIARDLGVLMTGGSDCHGGNKDEILLGKVKLPCVYVEQLLVTARQT